jgi:hypothetical protein
VLRSRGFIEQQHRQKELRSRDLQRQDRSSSSVQQNDLPEESKSRRDRSKSQEKEVEVSSLPKKRKTRSTVINTNAESVQNDTAVESITAEKEKDKPAEKEEKEKKSKKNSSSVDLEVKHELVLAAAQTPPPSRPSAPSSPAVVKSLVKSESTPFVAPSPAAAAVKKKGGLKANKNAKPAAFVESLGLDLPSQVTK